MTVDELKTFYFSAISCGHYAALRSRLPCFGLQQCHDGVNKNKKL
jgi:hypothetical protein